MYRCFPLPFGGANTPQCLKEASWTLLETEREKLADTPKHLLKVIPHVDGSTRICEPVRIYLRDVVVLGAWGCPGALELHSHALAPIADLPVKCVVNARHVVANLTRDIGEVAFDYPASAAAMRRC